MRNRILRICQRLVQIWFRLQLRLEVIGAEHIPLSGALIVAPNHVSAYDPFLVGSLLPRVSYYLAKKELFDSFFLGILLRFLKAIPVHRDGNSISALRGIRKALEKGAVVLMFPEGTRSRDGTIGPPKQGVGMLADMSQAAIIPAYISGMYRTRPSLLRRPHVVVTFGTPILPAAILRAGVSRRDRYEAISREVHARMLHLASATPRKQGNGYTAPVPAADQHAETKKYQRPGRR